MARFVWTQRRRKKTYYDSLDSEDDLFVPSLWRMVQRLIQWVIWAQNRKSFSRDWPELQAVLVTVIRITEETFAELFRKGDQPKTNAARLADELTLIYRKIKSGDLTRKEAETKVFETARRLADWGWDGWEVDEKRHRFLVPTKAQILEEGGDVWSFANFNAALLAGVGDRTLRSWRKKHRHRLRSIIPYDAKGTLSMVLENLFDVEPEYAKKAAAKIIEQSEKNSRQLIC